MNWIHIIELLIPCGITAVTFVVGHAIRDAISKTSTKHRLDSLEKGQALFIEEHKQFNQTLNETNQHLASLNATVKGLAGWLERIDERQYEQQRDK